MNVLTMLNNQADTNSYRKLASFKVAIKNHHLHQSQIIEKVLERDGDINYQIPANEFIKSEKPNLLGTTVLHLVIGKFEKDIFKTLLQKGADCTIKNAKELTALHQLFESAYDFYKHDWNANFDEFDDTYGYLKSVLSICAEARIFTHPCDPNGISLLHIACMANDDQTVKIYLENGISPNEVIDVKSTVFPGYTPLHFTAKSGNVELTKMLLQYGADPRLKNGRQMTALHVAIDRYMEIIDFLHVNRLKDNVTCEDTCFKAEIHNFSEVIKLVVSKMLEEEEDGLTLFHASCILKDSSLASEILESGIVDVNFSVKSNSLMWPGYTPLHFAAHFNAETFKLLLDKGADVEVEDVYGVKPLDICVERFKVEDIHFIISSHSKRTQIVLSDGKTKLVDLIEAMQSAEMLDSFLDNHSVDVNSFVPTDSTLWPGYSILHMAVMFTESIQILMDSTVEDFDQDSRNSSSSASERSGDDRSSEDSSDESSDSSVNSENDEEDQSEKSNDSGSSYSSKQLDRIREKWLSGYIERLKVCLNRGADVTLQDACGTTSLHLAFRLRLLKTILQIMLEFHENCLNPTDKDGLSHLYIACYAKNYSLVEKLLLNGAEVNSPIHPTFKWFTNQDSYINKYKSFRTQSIGSTPLHISTQVRSKKIIKILLKHGADVNVKDCHGFTPIHRIINRERDLSTTASVLLSSPKLRQSTCDNGLNHLHIACFFNHLDAVGRLLDLGADINATLTGTRSDFILPEPSGSLTSLERLVGYTPLHIAMVQGNDKVVRLLLQRNADIFIRNARGWSTFHESLEYLSGRHLGICRNSGEDEELIISLLQSEVSLQKRMQEDSSITMLHIACWSLDVHAVVEFLRQGMDVNAQVHLDSPVWPGWTPLHVLITKIAADWSPPKKEVKDIIEIIMENKVDLMLTDSKLATPLHLVLTRSTTLDWNNVCKYPPYSGLLLKSLVNFDVNPTSIEGISHLHVACFLNDAEVVEQLLKNGADVNQSIDFFSDEFPGCTALHIAVIHCKTLIDLSSRLATVDVLVKYGADVNAEDAMGNTPLHFAAGCESPRGPLFEHLARAGANICAQNIYGETAMEVLMKSANVTHKDIEFFLKSGYHINSFNPLSNVGYISKIFWEPQSGEHESILKAVIEKVIDASDALAVDDAGRTIIHNIVSGGWGLNRENFAYALSKLSERGYDVDSQDLLGRTALHTAVDFISQVGVKELLKFGADVNVTDANGETPFTLAIQAPWEINCQELQMDIRLALASHICIMQVFGLPVSELNSRTLSSLPPNYKEFEEMESFKCVEMISDLEIGSLRISLCDFLSNTGTVAAYPMMGYADRLAIEDFFSRSDIEEILGKKFADLKSRIISQYRKIQRRMTMVEPAIAALNELLAFPLPELCCQAVLRFLTNKDLENLLSAKRAL